MNSKNMCKELYREYSENLLSSNSCMLPSFSHILPTGPERETYLALDVGGSNFRLALVKLND